MSDSAGIVAGDVADFLPEILPDILPGLLGRRDGRQFQEWAGLPGEIGVGEEGYDIAGIVAGASIGHIFAAERLLVVFGLVVARTALKRKRWSGFADFTAGDVADPDGRWGLGIRGVCCYGHGVKSTFHGR